MSRSERKNVGFSVSPFDLAKMHGFNPSSWRKRADGVVEMLVENSAGSFPAWFRATPQAELYVLEGPSDLPYPAWTKASSVKWNPARTDIAANAEASVMATLLPAQLWRQASGAGSEWAMWELQRRGITSRAALPNPRAAQAAKKNPGPPMSSRPHGWQAWTYDQQTAWGEGYRDGLRETPNYAWTTSPCYNHYNAGIEQGSTERMKKAGTLGRFGLENPRQVTGPDACSRCEGTGYAGMHGDTCSRCEGSGVDALESCEGGCGKRVRESQGMCRPCAQADDEEKGIVRDAFGYPIRPSRPKARFNPSRLEQWALHRDKPDSPYKPPEAGPLVATGRIYGRPGFPDGKQVVTSAIRSVDGRLLTTVSGSVYSLGEVAPEYASFCARKGIDPLQVAIHNPKLAAFVGGDRGLRLRDLAVHGSGPMGGYTPEERSRVPSSMFLKPQSRSWPVSDETHAHIALQYMTRGFGGRQEYPSLVRRLATLWPVSQNPEIWADYSSKKRSIESKCGCRMPSLSELGG